MDELGFGLVIGVGLLFVKETGVPVPVPGDLIVLGLGATAAQGAGDPLLIVLLVIGATIAGGAIQFLALGGPGRRLLLAASRRVGLGEERIERQASRLRGGGARAVAVARMTPGLRIVAIAGAAFAALPFARFLAGLAVGNGVFVGGHFAAGFVVGPAAGSLVSAIGIGIAMVVVVVVALAGLVAWRLMLSRRARARIDVEAEDGVAEWTDASCPACLVVGVLATRRNPDPVSATP